MRRHNFWEGSLSFGLVNIPVILQSAENKSSELSFSLLDRRDMAPVGYRKINKISGAEVSKEDIVKGYEYEKGRFVTLTDDDFKRASVEKTQTIEIVTFVEPSEIEPIYYERPYYLKPAKKKEKTYVLFREALARAKKTGIATFVMHSREHIGAVSVYGSLLLLDMLRFNYEILPPAALDIQEKDLRKSLVGEKELEMAEKLILGMAGRWEPELFRDEYQKELLAFIRKKVKMGKTETLREELPPVEAADTRDEDIMSLLKRSMARVDHPAARHGDHHRRASLLH